MELYGFKLEEEFEDGVYVVKVSKRLVDWLNQPTQPFEDDLDAILKFGELQLDGLYLLLESIVLQTKRG